VHAADVVKSGAKDCFAEYESRYKPKMSACFGLEADLRFNLLKVCFADFADIRIFTPKDHSQPKLDIRTRQCSSYSATNLPFNGFASMKAR